MTKLEYMEEILDKFEDELEFTDRQIFTEIWFNPRKVLSFIHRHQYDKYVFILFILVGVTAALDGAVESSAEESIGLWMVMLYMVAGVLLVIVAYYINAALLMWTGRWLGGKADIASLVRILAYSAVPVIVGSLLLIPKLLATQTDLFWLNDDASMVTFFTGIALLQGLFSLHSMILNVIGISEIQGFSIMTAIVNLILAVFVLVIPMVLIILLFVAS